jgi:tripartite-type tricarboxylate transporter receptor subunit TctC
LKNKTLLIAACGASAFALPLTSATAQNYPTKPIRMIVPYPPGGGTDIVGRMVAQKLSENLGQTVVIDNRGGAAGSIGSEIAAHSVPDGYSIVMGNVAPNAINVSLYAKLGYDPVKDFEPVSLVASTPNILVVQPAFPAKTVPELITLAKAKPSSLNYPSAGLGSSSHLAGELFDNLAGVKMVHIPYKGGGPALIDLLGGQMQLMFATMPAAMPHVKSGRLRAIAVTSVKHSQTLPDLPTIGETLKGYDASTWYGVLAPARTPRPVVTSLHAEIVKILGVAETRERLLAQGFEPVGSTPAEFGNYIKSEIAKWGKVIKAAGIKPE